VTRDYGVVAAYTQQLRWGIRNGRPIDRTAEHVGYIEEILELDYRNHCTTVLLCEWVKASRDVRIPTIERDCGNPQTPKIPDSRVFVPNPDISG
jgi:hypothetical protein